MNTTMRRLTLVIATILLATTGLLAQVAAPVPVQSSGFSSDAEPVFTDVPTSRSVSVSGFDPFSRGRSKTPVLVVPAADISVEDIRAVREDMTIMVGIFRKMLSQAHLTPGADNAPFVGSLFGRSTQNTENIYLQGFGVLFMMNVDFPLAPGPQAPPAAAGGEDADVDRMWQETRQSLFEPQRRDSDWGREENVVEYSQAKVEDLKTTIIKALKHAANIRALAPTELVVVTITGRPISENIRVSSLPGTNAVVVVEQGGKTRLFEGGVPDDVAQSMPGVLTLRAKVSDITSYAKGDVGLDQFRQRVQVIMYPKRTVEMR